MATLVDQNTRVICKGLPGSQGAFHSEQTIAHGTEMPGAEKILKAVKAMNWAKTLAVFFLFTLPAQAQMSFKAEDFLSSRGTAQGGAMIACASGVLDPAAADAVLTGAGWTKSEGDSDGTWEYRFDNHSVTMWDSPGFCMVEDTESGTDDMAKNFLGLPDLPPVIGTDADGCTTYLLDTGVIAALSGPGQDPACTSDVGSAMRFSLPN